MAITFVAEAHGTTASGYNTSIAVTKPTGTVDNDVLVAIVGGTQSGTPSGWTLLHSIVSGGSSLGTCYVYYKVAASEGSSYTFTLSGTFLGCATILCYRGVSTTTPIDTTNKTATAVTASTDMTPSSITADGTQWAVTWAAGYNATINALGSYTESSGSERNDFGIAGGSPDNTSMSATDSNGTVSSGSFSRTVTRNQTADKGARGAFLLNPLITNVSVNAESPTAASAAYDAVVQTGVAAQAGVATATSAAFDIAVGVQAAISTSATAYDASVQIKASGVEVATAQASAGQVGANYGAPPGRTITVGAESRSYSPPAESRVYTISIIGED